jgi:hypothetical protein
MIAHLYLMVILAGIYLRGFRRAPAPAPPATPPTPAIEALQFPAPTDVYHNCPCCGYRPCSDDCRLGLSQYDLDAFEQLTRESWEDDDEEEDDACQP